MKNLKRALSFALATVMLVGMMVVGASAASFNDYDEIENIDAVNTLVALGIIKGKDTGDFDPAGTVTRAEMAKMICVALNGGKDPNFTGVGLYADTKGHWAAGYIDYCTNMGIVSGDTAGNFNPDKAVTGTEAAKMLLIALGFDAKTEKFVNDASWALNIDRRATEKELYDGISVLPAAALSRDNAAQMIFNALQAQKVKYVISGIIDGTSVSAAEDTNKTILGSTFDVIEAEGTLTAIAYDEESEKNVYTVGGDDFKSEADYSDLYGMNVKVLYKVKNNKTTVYGIFAEDSVVLGEGLISGISISDGKVKFAGTTYKYDFDIAGTEVAKSDIPVVAFNSGAATTAAAAQASAEAKLIDMDGNGKLDKVIYKPFTVEKVTYVGKDNFTAGKNVDFEDVTVVGEVKKNGFVKITAAANTIDGKTVYEVIDEVITGKVTNTKSNTAGKVTDVKIDGTWYKLATADMLALKGEYKKMAVVNGYIFTKEGNDPAASADEYAVVTAAEAKGGLNEYARAILLLTSGEKVTVDTETDYTGLVNQLVTYEIDDDVYTLTAAKTAAADVVFDGVAANTYADNKIDGKTIADDAVIFIKGSKSTKVVTGAELKKADAITVNVAYYDTNDTTGFGTIVLAYVSGTISSTSDNLYGYVTKAPEAGVDADDKVVYEITMGKETVTTKGGVFTSAPVAKGDLIVYKTNEKGLVTSIAKITAADSIDTGISAAAKAVVAYDGEKIAFNGDSNEYEITEDTVVLYVNTDKVEVSDGTISLADKAESGAYINNVYAATKISGSDKEVILLVVDVNNKLA